MKKIKFFVGILAILSFIFIAAKNDDDDFLLLKNLEIYQNILKELRTKYVNKINPEELITYSINKMLESLDPYTVYFSESNIEEAKFYNEGRYMGVGIIVDVINGKYYITTILDGSPAEKNGLKIGDIILKINNKEVTNLDYNQFKQLITGSTIKMTVLRNDKEVDLELKRKSLKINPIDLTTTIKDYGYIKLSNFMFNASNQFKKAFIELKKKEIKGLIIDLRDNPGGLLNEARNIVSFFIPKNNLVVSVKGKSVDTSYYTNKKPIDLEIPIIILVNENSASASEILSGNIQDYDRGIIVGRRTYGKGLVQEIVDVGYNSKLKITVSKYYIPSGRCIQAIDYSKHISYKDRPDSLLKKFKTKNGRIVYESKGIKPDIIVKKTEETDFIKKLKNQKLIFLFAVDYYYKHPTINTSVDSFQFTDKQAFINFLHNKKFTFEPKSLAFLDSLKTELQKEKDKENLQIIENSGLKLNRDVDYYVNRDFDKIKRQIEQWLVKMYYGNKGLTKYNFNHSPEIDTAVALLNNQERYKKILNPQN